MFKVVVRMVQRGLVLGLLIGAFSDLLLVLGQQLRWLQHPSGRPVMAYAVSSDGQVVVGELPYCCPGSHGGCGYIRHPLRWVVPTGEVFDLAFYMWGDLCYPPMEALDANIDGSVIVGRDFRFDWEEGRVDWYYNAFVDGVSGDGSVVVGWFFGINDRAFRHVQGQPIEPLGTLGGNESRAFDCSWDGSVVVGSAQNTQGNWRAFRWTPSTGMQDLGVLFPIHWAGRATGVSADGRVVVGWTQGFTSRAFRWRLGVGMQPLGAFAGGGNTFAYEVSADGRVVVGVAQVGMEERAVRWGEDGHIEDLNIAFATLLQPGEVLRHARGVSANGRYIVGWGERNGVIAAYWLDTYIRGDVDGNGCVDDADLLRVLFAFGQSGSGLPEDLNGDGIVDDADLLAVLFRFGSGC
jgi:probable HAF family extracellular repeat protein